MQFTIFSHGYSRIVVERQRHKQPYAYGRLVNSGSWFFFGSANTSWNMLLQMCRRDLSKKRKVPCVRWFDVFVQFTAVFVVSVYLYQRCMHEWDPLYHWNVSYTTLWWLCLCVFMHFACILCKRDILWMEHWTWRRRDVSRGMNDVEVWYECIPFLLFYH